MNDLVHFDEKKCLHRELKRNDGIITPHPLSPTLPFFVPAAHASRNKSRIVPPYFTVNSLNAVYALVVLLTALVVKTALQSALSRQLG
jgi:hypothetical protein